MSAYRRLDTNVPGPFYVNSACIDCDTCRQLAPEIFAESGGYSAVMKQPEREGETRRAIHALLSCPTAAIVCEEKEGIADAMDDFPLRLDENVYYCGFTSSKSYGGSSYLIVRPEGNWMIDSPRYLPSFVSKLEALGGVHTIFLTHRDDVADAKLYADRFGAERIIHIDERSAQPDAEHIIEAQDSVQWDADFKVIVTPGHTRGHMVLLYQNRYLFTGDHLSWDRERKRLAADRDYCWYSWKEQVQSMQRLAAERFEWVLPGHGQRVRLDADGMKREMERLTVDMQASLGAGGHR